MIVFSAPPYLKHTLFCGLLLVFRCDLFSRWPPWWQDTWLAGDLWHVWYFQHYSTAAVLRCGMCLIVRLLSHLCTLHFYTHTHTYVCIIYLPTQTSRRCRTLTASWFLFYRFSVTRCRDRCISSFCLSLFSVNLIDSSPRSGWRFREVFKVHSSSHLTTS